MTGTLFDAAARTRDHNVAARARDVAVAKHDELTTDLILRILTRYLRGHRHVHTDDLWPLLEAEGLEPGRYVGKAFQRAQRDGLMAKVGIPDCGHKVFAARASTRSNLAPKWIYRSLIYGQAAAS